MLNVRQFKKILKSGILKLATIALVFLAVVAVIGFEYYTKDIGTNSKAASDGCPSNDWAPVGDFCIMDSLLAGGAEEWGKATYSCLHEKEARLCTTVEWMQACRDNSITSSEYEWVGDIENGLDEKAVLIGKTGCGDISSAEIEGNDFKRRCCINRERH